VRRRDREIADRGEIDQIIRSALVCRIAMADKDEPYVVPLSFGYDGRALFIHTAKTGRKLDFFAANGRVCFELENDVSLRRNNNDPCEWSFTFESVIGYGTISELTGTDEKAQGLNQIMLHYSDREWHFDETAVATSRVWRIDVQSVTGKRSREKPGS
jgi:nitroimidazol reductase NimA-like FMN-containing flavoprotein (pyridoxamine 5'-phosphate oxidase superfamily)